MSNNYLNKSFIILFFICKFQLLGKLVRKLLGKLLRKLFTDKESLITAQLLTTIAFHLQLLAFFGNFFLALFVACFWLRDALIAFGGNGAVWNWRLASTLFEAESLTSGGILLSAVFGQTDAVFAFCWF